MGSLQERLINIQKNLKVPKNQFNEFGKYKYRSCEDILEAVKPLLVDIVLTISDELVTIGTRYYLKATATLQKGEEAVFVTAYAREEEIKKGMDSAQITGSVSSYARKYALNGLFLIDDTKDADHNNQGDNGENDKQKKDKTPLKTTKPELATKKTDKVTTLQERRLKIVSDLKTLQYSSEDIANFCLIKVGTTKTSGWDEQGVEILEEEIKKLKPPERNPGEDRE